MVEAGIVDDRIAGAMDDFSVDGRMPDWQAVDLQNDNAASALVEEFDRRSAALGNDYPFEITRTRLRYKKRKSLVYEFCLAVAQSPSLTTGEFATLPRLFERMSARISADYLGKPSEFAHTGAPRDGTPAQTFKAAIEHIALRSGEWRWDPEQELPMDGPTAGDEGADFFAWKLAPDGRQLGQLFLVGQCACGSDWRTKWGDLDVRRLTKWMRSDPLVPAVRAFATPYVISDGMLREASRHAGIVFDRLRLTKIAAVSRVHFSKTPWDSELQKAIDMVSGALS